MLIPSVGSVEQILVYPVNGYVNRLQTLASAWILAEQLEARFTFCWVPSEFAPADAGEVFSASFVERFSVLYQAATDLVGTELGAIPRYVSRNRDSGWLGLRGHDRGEQALLPELFDEIERRAPVPLLVIVAGGKFFAGQSPSDHVSDDERFLGARQEFYRNLVLHESVERAVETELERRESPYVGLHLRYGDRDHQAPSRSEIRRGLRRATEDGGLTDVFIASDSPQVLIRWHQEAVRMGLRPWSVDGFQESSSADSGVHAALIDWRLLGHADRLVYFSASSYSAEAAVAAGAWQTSVALEPHQVRAAASLTRFYAKAAARRLRRAVHGR